LPAIEEEHESVDVPEPPAMLVNERVQARFVELVVTARLTVLVKPLKGATVIVDVPEISVLTETVVGLALALKSGTGVTW
jgi:hypothetical protein